MMNIKENHIILCQTENQINDIKFQFLKQNNKTIYRLPEIKLIDKWIFEKFEEYFLVTEFDLLNGIDEKFIWEEIIRQDKILEKNVLTQKDIDYLCQLSRNTNKKLTEYLVSENQIKKNYSNDEFIYKWREKFLKICKERGLITQYEFISIFIEKQKNRKIISNQNLYIIESDTVSPIYQTLLKELAKHNKLIKHEINPSKTNNLKRYEFNNAEDELKAVTEWIKKNKANKKNNLLIISPALHIFQKKLENQINIEIQPEIFSNFKQQNIYNTSFRRTLVKEPIVWAVYELIRLNHNKPKPIEFFTQLLSFNNWIDKEHFLDREKLSNYLSKTNIKRFSIFELCTLINKDKFKDLKLESLKKILNNILKNKQKWIKPQTIKAWVAQTQEFLISINLGKINELLIFEINSLNRFYQLLHELSSNRLFTKKVSFIEYLNKLNFYLETYNPPPFNPDASIDIYEFDQYPIKDYDAIWIMNMNSNYYPGGDQNNIFISKNLKEQYHINDDKYYKETLTLNLTRISKVSEDISISYSKKLDDLDLIKTPLPNNFNIIEENNILSKIVTKKSNNIFEYIDDNFAPPLPKQTIDIKRGKDTLNAQLICPAWGFFEYRLGAGVNEPDLQEEISSMARGTMVHKVLEIFWSEVKTHENLLKICKANFLDEKITIIIDEVIGKYKKEYPRHKEIHINLEKLRLLEIIKKWFEFEMKRGLPFKIIELEKVHVVKINGIQFNIKLDRIDLIDNQKIIIDYKTGEIVTLSDLYKKNELKDIQLPLYACFTDNNINGVAYAQVKYDKQLITGVSEQKFSRSLQFNDKYNSTIDSWDKLKKMWAEIIIFAAKSYHSGDATIKFKKEENLKYCMVKPILRLPERKYQYERSKSK